MNPAPNPTEPAGSAADGATAATGPAPSAAAPSSAKRGLQFVGLAFGDDETADAFDRPHEDAPVEKWLEDAGLSFVPRGRGGLEAEAPPLSLRGFARDYECAFGTERRACRLRVDWTVADVQSGAVLYQVTTWGLHGDGYRQTRFGLRRLLRVAFKSLTSRPALLALALSPADPSLRQGSFAQPCQPSGVVFAPLGEPDQRPELVLDLSAFPHGAPAGEDPDELVPRRGVVPMRWIGFGVGSASTAVAIYSYIVNESSLQTPATYYSWRTANDVAWASAALAFGGFVASWFIPKVPQWQLWQQKAMPRAVVPVVTSETAGVQGVWSW